MKRTIFLSTLILLCALYPGFSDDIIDPGSSNQSASTMGFEENAYDWLLDPLSFDRIEDSTLFFSLDGAGRQFGQDAVNSGFRGGYARMGEGFSPLFALNYYTDTYLFDDEPEENRDFSYDTYDSSTGRYDTIYQSINTSSRENPLHLLMFHFGARLEGPVNFDLQTYWRMDCERGDQLSFTNQYTNTATVSEASLDVKGSRTDTSWDLISSDNILAFEPELGLDLGDIQLLIAPGVAFYNMGAEEDSWKQTVTNYAGGSDPTVVDQTVVDRYTGSYYYNGSRYSGFDMNTNEPIRLQRTLMNLDTGTVFALDDDLELRVPFYAGMTLYPDLSTVYSKVTTGFNDSTTTPIESSRTTEKTTTTLDIDHDFHLGIGGELKKTIRPSFDSTLYLGVETGFTMRRYSDTRERWKSTRVQQDNDGDGQYTTAGGIDIDTTYTESGYEIQTQENTYSIDVSLPIGVSYSPVDKLTFHAGTSSKFSVSLTDSSDLITGSAPYLYEEYTDNLVAANSYDRRQKDNSDNVNTPVASFESEFDFAVQGGFGFTLEISDNFSIDAVAIGADNMEMYQFSLMGIYSH